MPSEPDLDKTAASLYATLPIPSNKFLATYIWIDGTGENVRGKTRTLNFIPQTVRDLPIWNYDGSSTYRSLGSNSDTYLSPVAIFNDPFMRGNNKLVLCDTYKYDKSPTESNKRVSCLLAMEAVKEFRPWFGLEQEYFLLDVDTGPFDRPIVNSSGPPGPYYCGVGANKVHGRGVMEAHYRACLYAGINITGTNAKCLLSKWEYQVGPCEGIVIGDHVWVSRYILHRVAEDFGVVASIDPKSVWDNRNYAHMNFSTKTMRDKGGLREIENAIEKLSKTHHRHIKAYDPREGISNAKWPFGRNTTSDLKTFTSGVANTAASVRIPRVCATEQKGYLEDRRPFSNCDPYSVSEALVRTCCLDQ